MILGLVPFPFVCGWCADFLPLLAWPVGLDSSLAWVVLAGHYQPLILVSPLAPFGPIWPGPLSDPGRPLVLCPLSLPVLSEALLRGWLVCSGCDGP